MKDYAFSIIKLYTMNVLITIYLLIGSEPTVSFGNQCNLQITQ